MTTLGDMTIRAPTSEGAGALGAGLDMAARIADAPRPPELADVQRLCNDFISEDVTDQNALIAPGLAFGDDVARHGGLVWVRVIDQHGYETCIAPPHHMTRAAPISVIEKRLKRREAVDLTTLRTATLDTIAKQMQIAGER